MAKKPVKEAGTALIFATVFFVLTTIALGVMWYTEMNKSAEKDQGVEKSNKEVTAARGEAGDAKFASQVYKIYFGVDDEDDRKAVTGWGDKEKKAAGDILKKINQTVTEKIAKGDASKMPAELTLWTADEKGMAPTTLPDKSPLASIGKIAEDRDTAKENEKKAGEGLTVSQASLKKQEVALADATKMFTELSKTLPADFDTKIKAEFKKVEDRLKKFTQEEAKSRDDVTAEREKVAQADRDKATLKKQIEGMQEQVAALMVKVAATRQQEAFQNDEPHGRILRRLPEGIVEINIGSDALVRPGLTFTVLPYDFPEKGRQSRMRVTREKDERGVYRDVPRFIEKANIEVIEVLGPKLSRARITKEYDPIRDGAAPGDLIYNAVWRKGAADRIALIGVFDANGDGTDDIESVIRDLNKMGVPVDAFYDMKTRKWVGTLTEHTRYVVEGWYPILAGLDPNREEKSKLLGDISNAVSEATKKGVSPVKFQDFFPRIGYRMKLDVTADKINQAIAPYLNKVSTPDAPPPGN
jgi:hypothetical protein